MIANTHYGYVKKAGKLQFTYTGQYNQREDGVVELLTSGTLVFLNPAVIDIFCVGGGGAGSSSSGSNLGNNQGVGGGGGGYTSTMKKQTVAGSYDIVIGTGATPDTSTSGNTRKQGGSTSFGTLVEAAGGYSGTRNRSLTSENSSYYGAPGGSGGGGGVISNSDYGAGGSNGNDGEQGYGYVTPVKGGVGQGTTTREFGEANGKLYGGGGGGGRYMVSTTPVTSMGGAGGGGTGAWYSNSGDGQAAAAGVANTGGGGGGGCKRSQFVTLLGASGGSGICCFRAAK